LFSSLIVILFQHILSESNSRGLIDPTFNFTAGKIKIFLKEKEGSKPMNSKVWIAM